MANQPEPRLYDTAELAAMFNRRPRTVRAWIARGILPVVRVGRTPFVSAADLEKFLETEDSK